MYTMDKRLQLHSILLEVLDSPNVYFQPPENVQMQYPCIVYARDNAVTQFAGNEPYKNTKRYKVTVIARNPDSEIPDKVALLPLCTMDRFFTAGNLNHDVFNLYF